MKKSLFLLLVASLSALCSCSDLKHKDQEGERIGKGNRIYGGILRLNTDDPLADLFYPPRVTDAPTTGLIIAQVYEGLVRFDRKDLSIKPSLAEKWTIDSTGTIYTFYLRKGARFHDDACFSGGKGREIKASDFKYSFELFCTAGKDNHNFGSTFKDKVKGANEFYDRSKNGVAGSVEGFQVIDDYTLRIHLFSRHISFLHILAYQCLVVLPQEAIEKYGTKSYVGNGPFRVGKKDPDITILVKNPTYYGTDTLGNQLPFLDSISITSIPSKSKELQAFLEGKVDLIFNLPGENVKQLTMENIADFQRQPPRYVLDRKPEILSQFYELNTSKPPFNNKKVRMAFSHAINKEKIVKEILNDEAYGSGINGITPPSFKGYDISKLRGYEYNPDKARKLLAQAGYPGGKNFPQVKLEVNNVSKYQRVAFFVFEELKKNLGVDVNVEIVPLTLKTERANYGLYEMHRSGWLADYPSPENFLSMFYGKSVPDDPNMVSYPNKTRYKNPEFDKYYEMGINAKTQEESYAFFLKAEQIMLDDAPVIPMWYDESYRLLHGRIRNFYSNPMRVLDLREVYVESPETESSSASTNP